MGSLTVWALPGSPFEGADGNLESDAGVDWESVVGSADLRIGHDAPSGQNDDSFRGKEDDAVPEIVVGSIPKNKSDLLRFYVTSDRVDVGGGVEKDFLHVAWIRDNDLGTANMDFEFNQGAAISGNGQTPVRLEGDMLVTFAFASGGNQANLGLSRWTETGPCEASASAPCWGPLMPLTGIAEGAVNGVDVLDPVAGETLAANTFGEASINLTDAGVFDRDECVSFGSAYVKSRSSDSFTSSMKDFILPIDVSVTNCATVTVRKNAVPDDPQDFTFVPSPGLDPSGPFLLDDDGDDANGLASFRVFQDEYDGTFTVEEQPVAGWDLTDVTCTEGATPETGTDGLPTGLVTLTAAPGDVVDCTYTNTKRGRIRVDVVTDPSGDPQSFDFMLSGGPDAIGQGFPLADGSPLHDSGEVRPGVYSLQALSALAAWDMTGAACDDGSPIDAIGLDPGEIVTCTVNYVKRGTILVLQTTDPAGDPQSFDFSLTGGPDAIVQAFSLADGQAPYSSGLVRSGSYAVAQTDAGVAWDLSLATCDDGSPVGAVSLQPGETVTCTFANIKRGKILVDVVTDPPGDPQIFDFTLTGGRLHGRAAGRRDRLGSRRLELRRRQPRRRGLAAAGRNGHLHLHQHQARQDLRRRRHRSSRRPAGLRLHPDRRARCVEPGVRPERRLGAARQRVRPQRRVRARPAGCRHRLGSDRRHLRRRQPGRRDLSPAGRDGHLHVHQRQARQDPCRCGLRPVGRSAGVRLQPHRWAGCDRPGVLARRCGRRARQRVRSQRRLLGVADGRRAGLGSRRLELRRRQPRRRDLAATGGDRHLHVHQRQAGPDLRRRHHRSERRSGSVRLQPDRRAGLGQPGVRPGRCRSHARQQPRATGRLRGRHDARRRVVGPHRVDVRRRQPRRRDLARAG
jgi:hypothetical protein